MKKCTHKIIDNHSRLQKIEAVTAIRKGKDTKRIWKCSTCKKEDTWSDGWQYYGNIECKYCGHQRIDRVHCPQCGTDTQDAAKEE